jgi:hypothetical protein
MMNRLELKYLEPILNFRYLQTKSKREGIKYIENMKIDIFDEFQDLIRFKMIQEYEKEVNQTKLQDGEHDYDGDWEVNRQNFFISQSRIELPKYEEFRNKYRKMLLDVKEAEEKKTNQPSIEEEVVENTLKKSPTKKKGVEEDGSISNRT